MAMDMNSMKSRGQQFLGGFTTGQKAITALAIVGLIAGGYFFTTWASQPSYTVLFAGLSTQDAAKVVDKLTSDGVPYKLSNGGTTIEVPQSKVYAERLALSSAGTIGGTGGEGWSLLDKQGITTSQFSQRVGYQRALAGELGKTISSINGVQTASVTLQIPEQNAFVGTGQKPSASVLIATKGGATLNSGQAKAIANLVSGSVQGLAPEDVTIADTRGVVLSTTGDATAGADGSAKTSFENGVSDSLQQMLTAVVGPSKSVVKVAANMNFDQKASTTERLEPVAALGAAGQQAPPISQSNSTETFTGAPQNGQTAATPDNYQKTATQQQNAYTKVVEQLKQAPGAVTRMSVSVLLDDKAVTQEQLANITTALTAAAGIDAQRGDTINVTRVPFDESMSKDAKAAASAAQSAESMNTYMGYLKLFGAILLIGAVLFMVRRSMKKAAANRPMVKVPLDLPAIEGGRGVSAATASKAAAQLQGAKGLISPDARETASLEAEISDLIDRQPEEVAATLRTWLATGRS